MADNRIDIRSGDDLVYRDEENFPGKAELDAQWKRLGDIAGTITGRMSGGRTGIYERPRCTPGRSAAYAYDTAADMPYDHGSIPEIQR